MMPRESERGDKRLGGGKSSLRTDSRGNGRICKHVGGNPTNIFDRYGADMAERFLDADEAVEDEEFIGGGPGAGGGRFGGHGELGSGDGLGARKFGFSRSVG